MPDNTITWAEIADAYNWDTTKNDYPDRIYVADGRCPICRMVIEAEVSDECPNCGFPKRS